MADIKKFTKDLNDKLNSMMPPTPPDELDKEAKELHPIPLPVSFLDWVSDEKYMRLSKSVGGFWFKVGASETFTSIELLNIFEKQIQL